MPELRISSEKVCDLIFQTRAYLGKVAPSSPDDTQDEEDDQPLAPMVERPGDATMEQLDEFITGLNEEERTDLLALLWLGRGDYDLDSWAAATAEARRQVAAGDARWDLDEESTPEFIEAGLEQFGGGCV
jgi:hypothetical protein